MQTGGGSEDRKQFLIGLGLIPDMENTIFNSLIPYKEYLSPPCILADSRITYYKSDDTDKAKLICYNKEKNKYSYYFPEKCGKYYWDTDTCIRCPTHLQYL